MRHEHREKTALGPNLGIDDDPDLCVALSWLALESAGLLWQEPPGLQPTREEMP